MKAITYARYGPPEVLEIKDVAKPSPQKGEVLIRVRAAEVTKADCEMRSFRFAVSWFWLPLRIAWGILRPRLRILGGYFAGEVEALGENVTGYAKGDAVFGCAGLRMGAHATYLCLPADSTIVGKPQNIGFDEAAAVPLGGLNALHFMKKARIQKGERVLINGAGGSIGAFAVQIAKAMGAEVTAVDSGIKEEMLRSVGVDRFIDYEKEAFVKDGEGYDVVFNMVAGSSYSVCINLLRSNGRYLMGNPRLSDMLRAVFTSWFTHRKALFAFAGETMEELTALREMIEAGTIRPVVDKVYAPEKAVEAHRRVETEQRKGIVVIAMS